MNTLRRLSQTRFHRLAPSTALTFQFATVGLIVAVLSGCAHQTHKGGQKASVERQLLLLEADFVRFTTAQLTLNLTGTDPASVIVLRACESDVKALEALRARYLTVVSKAVTHEQRLLAMIRLAELHLDFGARLRRVAYPVSTVTDSQRALFDQKLSNAALPYEAVGLGILNQIVRYSAERSLSGRMSRRADMYIALHTELGASLEPRHIQTLREELSAKGPYRSPRRLLETGRIGQWAARR